MSETLACKHPMSTDHAQLYQILVSESKDFAIFLADPDGCIATWNPGVERCLGYAEADWLGQSLDIIFTPEDRATGQSGKELQKAQRDGQSADVRWHLRRDGSRLFVEGTLIALRGNDGKLLGFSKVMRDITERKNREIALQDSLAYAESIVDTVREPLLVLDKDFRVRSANRSFYRTFQLSREAAADQSIFALGNGKWDSPSLRTLLQEIVPAQTSVENFELTHDFPNVGRKVLVVNARKLWREGNHTELMLLAFEDVTERREAEKALAESSKQLQLIIDTAPALIGYIDRNLRYRLLNKAYERWFGASPASLIGRTVYDLFGSRLIAAVKQNIRKVLAGETVSFEEEYSGPLGPRTLLVTYTPDLNEQGETQGFMVLGSDISERKKSELALQKSEERWRSLFDGMAEGFFVGEIIYDGAGMARNFRFVQVNPAFEKLTGVSDAVGKTVREAIPGIQDELIDSYVRVVRTGEPANFEVYVPVLQDSWYDVRARYTEPGRFAVLFVNITARKIAETQLRDSERYQAALVALGDRLRDLKDISSITLAAMEIVGTTLGVTRAGYGEVDASGENLTITSDWTNGRVDTLAGIYRFADFGEDLGSRLNRGELIVISNVESDPTTSLESERWSALDIQSVINVPLIENARLSALLFIQNSTPRNWTAPELTFIRKVADRTWSAAERAHALQELRESEEFTRSILASSPDCVKVIGLDGRLITMNEGGCLQMEIKNLAVRVNQPWTGFWKSSQAEAEGALARAKNGYTSRFESFRPMLDGTPKWWEVVVTPIRDASGNPVRILSLARDITNRQLAEQERERLTRELQRSNEDLSQFAHIVAHDLQAPLRGVVTFAQLLQRTAQERLVSHDLEFLQRIVDGARRMQDLVQALLRFAQVGQGDIETEPVEMETVLDAALQSLQVEIVEQEATVTRGVLPTVLGDSVQLEQLLQNLIGNALKYRRPDEPAYINIRAVRDGAAYRFAIEDNGEGIAPEHRERIFEPLKRLHGTEVPGSGLGLATCQRIVARHGGRIWVESQPGVGSTFFFTMPAAS